MKVCLLLVLSLGSFHLMAQVCRYSYTVWNTRAKRSEGPILVNKTYSSLEKHEKGPRGCTPCESDQVEVRLKNGLGFKACKHFASDFEHVLNQVLDQGRRIESVLSYRVSVSKGVADASGKRTELSHHAFGAAIDINEGHNGLYNNCVQWSPQCILSKGGAYLPSHPLSIKDNDEFVSHFKNLGFQWGGQIKGQQKDFMHFSLSGY